jgi:hypothetical protein
VPLAHSPLVIVFLDQDTACLAYSSHEYAFFNPPLWRRLRSHSRPHQLQCPQQPEASLRASLAMSLGFGAEEKLCVVAMSGLDVLIVKDSRWLLCVVRRDSSSTQDQGIFVGKDGKPSRTTQIDWPAPPDETCGYKIGCSLLEHRVNSCSSLHQALRIIRSARGFTILPASTTKGITCRREYANRHQCY